jgi:hypothetical protein
LPIKAHRKESAREGCTIAAAGDLGEGRFDFALIPNALCRINGRNAFKFWWYRTELYPPPPADKRYGMPRRSVPFALRMRERQFCMQNIVQRIGK